MNEENLSSSTNDKSDKLTDIEGLGSGFAKDLAKIGIHNPSDLAQYKTPQDLRRALLQQANTDIPLGRIQNKSGQKGDWLHQARELTQQTKSEHALPEKETNTVKTSDETWHEHAYFTLKFEYKMDKHGQRVWRTYVYQEQNGEDNEFGGLEAHPWVNWIYEQAKLPTSGQSFRDIAKFTPTESLGTVPTTPPVPDRLETKAGDAQISRGRVGQKHDITLKRGGKKIEFKKVDNAFAVRLKRGMVTDEKTLEYSLGLPRTVAQHVASDKLERLDIFRLETAVELEETMQKLREAPNTEVITHLYAIDDTPGAEIIPTGTITIQFNPDTKKLRREKILEEFGLEIVEDIDYLDHGHTVALTAASTENPLKIAAKLQELEEIMLAEPDLHIPPSFEYEPNDQLYPSQWHLKNRGDQTGLTPGADVKAEEAWDHTKGSRKVTICIIDDGFDLGHPDFDVPQKIVAPRDFGQNDFDPNPVSYNDNHGTACAGVALAEENGRGVVGLAPDCAFMPIRFESISDNAIVNYFQYAMDNGADVISCSWKARSSYYPLSAKASGIIHKAATQGRSGKGCVILFAAGNEGKLLDDDGYHQGFALHPDVIAVAASNSLDKRSSYSNYGPEITICAPSDGSPGRKIVTTDRQGINGYTYNDYTFSFGGTSSATPLAAGLAALILSVNPKLTAAEVKQIMMETADKIDPTNGRYVNGHSPWYGHGRINAHQAVIRAVELAGSSESSESAEDDMPQDDETTAVLEISKVSLLQSGQSLIAEVLFQVSGTNANTLTADRLPFRVDAYLIDRDNGSGSQLVDSEQEQLKPQNFVYTSLLKFPMPGQGNYELQSRVTLSLGSGTQIKTIHQGPAFRVKRAS